MPEVYRLKDNAGYEVVVKSFDRETNRVTVVPRLGGEEQQVLVDQLDFVEGELHIVDWSSTIAAVNKAGVEDSEGYSGQ